jgi:F-type H+-transporting ATPase subunit gamma
MAGAREIKRRIKSVKNTKKITRAMQMVSAAKMRKAQNAVTKSRTYSELAWQIVQNLSSKIDPKYHRLLQTHSDEGKVGIILISSNKGLIGGFNSSLLAFTKRYLKENDAELLADFVVMGRKGRDAMLRSGKNIVAEFNKYDRTPNAEEVLPIAKLIINDYLEGRYSKIVVIYTHFVSTVVQKPMMKQLLPLRDPDKARHSDEMSKQGFEYLIEPSPQEVLDFLLPRIIESQIFQAVLESDASEHSARMIMMKNATDAATELIDDLTLAYNQLRQANITKELAEITAGRIALE